MWFVYILLCVDNSFYTGISKDPDQRLRDHLHGKGGRYTRAHKPLKRVYLEEVGTRSLALKREHQIKTWTRKMKIHNLGLDHLPMLK